MARTLTVLSRGFSVLCMDSKGERVQNGIMFAKERRLMELEQASARLQEEL